MDSTIKTVRLLHKWLNLLRNDCLASIHPITQRIEERQKRKSEKSTINNGLSTDTIPFYTSAYDMDMRVIDVYAAATEHVDQVCH